VTDSERDEPPLETFAGFAYIPHSTGQATEAESNRQEQRQITVTPTDRPNAKQSRHQYRSNERSETKLKLPRKAHDQCHPTNRIQPFLRSASMFAERCQSVCLEVRRLCPEVRTPTDDDHAEPDETNAGKQTRSVQLTPSASF